MNSYIQKMGVDTSKLQFCEVLSLDDWALDMVPRPVTAVRVCVCQCVNMYLHQRLRISPLL